MPTISDVAQKAGVSKTTVSRVLNHPDLVNEETKKRVHAVMKDLSYSPSILAQGMRAQRTRSFGVVIPDFKNLYYAEFVENVEIAARHHGYIAIMCSTEIDPDREREYITKLIQRQVDGLIMCWYKNVSDNRDFLVDLAKKLPVVIMDQPSQGMPVSSVYTDGFKGIYTLTRHLIECGHRKIAIVRSLKKYPVGNSRYEGYLAALKKGGLGFDQDLVHESEWTASGASAATENILRRADPTAIIGVTDLMALGILKCVIDRGCRVPEDIAVAGYDDIIFSSLMSPRLTTIAQPVDKMAWKATEQLIRRIENRHVRNRDIELENRLIIRESTQPVVEEAIAQTGGIGHGV
jgi:DNA-binding LacI/PurR family transcriptional regulator